MENILNRRPKPLVLVILDGWGISQPYAGNAVTQAETPIINGLIAEYPSMTLRASGEAVGLPWGEPGNSEVGHTNLGLGRILYQDLPRINREIGNNNFYKNGVLLEAIEHAKVNDSSLHFMGIVSNGCVHGSIDHLHALLVLAKEKKVKKVFVHAFLDGRDTQYDTGVNFIKGVERSMDEYGIGKIATISGRFYAMDRNNDWDRISKSYLAMTEGLGNRSESALQVIEDSYRKKIYDEEFVPTVITEGGAPRALIKDGDAVVFFNYRPDRARQMTKAFVAPGFDKFARKKLENLFFATFTEYEKDLPVRVVFPSEDIKNALGDLLAENGLRQLRIAETEKYAHVTYFFNGGREIKSDNEDHVLVPSPQVTSYDQRPEMSAKEITDRFVEAVESEKYDVIIVNYANADMVGHTGDIAAAIRGIEFLDKQVGRILRAVLEKRGLMMITADHGNAEIMLNMQTGQADREHTSNPVPLIMIAEEFRGRNIGWQNVIGGDLSLVQPQGILSDVAPTILKILGIKKPDEMTGMSLV